LRRSRCWPAARQSLNPKVRVELFGQELNGESFGICKSDMPVTGHNSEQIAFGNTLTDDAHTPVQRMGVLRSRINLPPKGRQVGLHIVRFEACSAFARVAACTRARSPSRDCYPEASDISTPPCLLRLLPAGADAGWVLHPLENAAFSRRTGHATILIFSCRPRSLPPCRSPERQAPEAMAHSQR
jgi:hypothetical protein